MEAWLLREWHRTGFWQILLRPLSWVFGALAAVRRRLYRLGILKSVRIGVPVIVVGNITVGGTGKTPVVLALVQHLALSGRRCGIVSRGYSRTDSRDQMQLTRGAVIRVVAESTASAVTSDEALLLALRSGVPVYTSTDRAAAARFLLRDHPEIDVLVSDDGLQHYGLHRDLEICVVDGERGFGNRALLPAGPLREPVTRLESVDAIVTHGAPGPLEIGQAAPVFSMTLGHESLVRVGDSEAMTMEQGRIEFSGKRILAIAGTGNPSRFFAHLERLGFEPETTTSFPDHHPYRAADFAGSEAGIILMTEKDAVKCKAFADERMWFMRVDAILPAAFGEFIVQRLSTLRK